MPLFLLVTQFFVLEVSHPWRPAPPRWHPRGERGEHTRRVCVAPLNPRGGVSPPEAVMLKIASLLSQFIVYLSSTHFSFILVSVNLVLFLPLFQQIATRLSWNVRQVSC